MKLTDVKLRHVKADGSRRKLSDGRGLYLLVTPTGGRYWRWKYRFGGREKLMALGVYPEVSLAAARNLHRDARLVLANGIDPVAAKRKTNESSPAFVTFKQAAQLWHEHWAPQKKVDFAKIVWGRLENDVFPEIGRRPVNDIPPSTFRDMLKRIEDRAPTVSRKIFGYCGQIMRYAVAHDLADRNTVSELQGSDFLREHRTRNHARVDEKGLPALLYAIDHYPSEVTRLAMRMLALTFVRVGEMLGATWSEFDLDNARWVIPSERMKMGSSHIVPLSAQAIEIIKRLKQITYGGEYLFPGRAGHKTTMSRAAILMALKSMGYRNSMTSHGFRGVASTILHEQGYDHEHIETQLAHLSRGKVSSAYNHALYIKPRTAMMQSWADYLDLKRGNYKPPV